MLADSNLVIYAASGNYPELVNWFLENDISTRPLKYFKPPLNCASNKPCLWEIR